MTIHFVEVGLDGGNVKFEINMIKRVFFFSCFILLTVWVRAQQWTSEDSLKLKRMLNGGEELKLNPEVVKKIDFGQMANQARMSEEKEWLLPDETLPTALPKPKVVLTLMPYSVHTPYNWDPIFQKKIHVDKDTWRSKPLLSLVDQLNPVNWRKMASREGFNFKMLSERANGMMVNSFSTSQLGGIGIGHGMYISGNAIGGLDLMAIFTKDFWDVKGRERRARTLELLKHYGDSTTVRMNTPMIDLTR